MIKLFLVSFASEDLKRSKIRFLRQANEMNIYEGIKIFSYSDLIDEKKQQIKNFFKKNQKRLFGYGSWKATIIKSYLEQIPKDSILQYSDVGCHFNKKGIDRLKDYAKLCDKNNILAFQYKKPDFNNYPKLKFQEYFEYEYTKGDLYRYLQIKDDSLLLKSQQIWSGTMFFKNNKFTKELLNEWVKVLNISNLIDDSKSQSKNDNKFIEHRHDQSAFSLLCKKNNILTLSASECEWGEVNGARTWEHLSHNPIHAKRDKEYNLFKRFINRQKKNLKRMFENAKN